MSYCKLSLVGVGSYIYIPLSVVLFRWSRLVLQGTLSLPVPHSLRQASRFRTLPITLPFSGPFSVNNTLPIASVHGVRVNKHGSCMLFALCIYDTQGERALLLFLKCLQEESLNSFVFVSVSHCVMLAMGFQLPTS